MPSSYVEVIDMANGVFAVRSQSDTDDKRNYRVQFNQPSCECYDWERQRMPCKHFFAVFLHVPAWSFERLPIPYRDSPFFTLDDDLFRTGPSNLEESNRIDKDEVDKVPSGTEQHIEFPEVPAVTEAVQLKNLPRKAARPRTSAAKCRELLGQIRNLTYIVEGLENCIILEEVIEKLETCHHLLLGSAPKENGVILEAPVKPNRVDLKKKKPRKKEKKVNFKKLPVPSKKNPFSGRVGEKANVMKRHYNVTLRDIQSQTPAKKSKLDVPKVIKEKCNVAGCDFQQRESANVAEDTTGETLEDDKEPANGTFHALEAPTAFPGSLQFNSPDCKPGCGSSLSAHASFQSSSKIKYTAEDVNDTTNLNSGSDDEVQFIASVKTTTSKTGRFILSEDDVKIIESGDWLTDHIIGAAQFVLRDQFPYIAGMENTSLGPVNNFTSYTKGRVRPNSPYGK